MLWTGEKNYGNCGVYPFRGGRGDDFTFRVKYIDLNNDAPSALYLQIKDDGEDDSIKFYPMKECDPSDIDYTDGKIYEYSLKLPVGKEFDYRFDVTDSNTREAEGPASTYNEAFHFYKGPFITNWEARQILDSTGDVGAFPILKVDSNDDIHICYFDNTNKAIKYLKKDDGSISIQTVDSPINYEEHHSMALDSSNNPHIAYYDDINQDLKYAYWNGSSWSFQIIDSSGDVGLYPSVAIDSTDSIHISYLDQSNNNLKYAKWNGTSWDIETVDSSSIRVGLYTSIAIDSSDYPHISYYDYSNNEIKYAKWNGSSWIIHLAQYQGPRILSICMSLDLNNNPYITYVRRSSSEVSADYIYSEDGGENWHENNLITFDSPKSLVVPPKKYFKYSILIDSNNIPYISLFHPMSNVLSLYTILFKKIIPETEQEFGELVDTANGSEQNTDYLTPSIDIDSRGYTHICFYDYINGDLLYKRRVPLPTLDWTGEDNYEDDGLHPETGSRLTDFVFRVKYSDEVYNNPPKSGYPKVHIIEEGFPFPGSPFTMEEVDPADNDYTDGKLYTYSRRLPLFKGTEYEYYFEAYDIVGSSAIGTPTEPIDAPDVYNLPPTLSWTGEENYISDGVHPEKGFPVPGFEYRVKYTDPENDPPYSGFPKVTILKCGGLIEGSPFSMNEADTDDTNYTDGKIYTLTKMLYPPGENYSYYFIAKDWYGAFATGEPTNVVDGPYVQGWGFEVVDSLGNVGKYSSIAIDSDNDIHIAYFDATNNRLKYAKGTPCNWKVYTVDVSKSSKKYREMAK
jgi:hypothetical protein